MGDQYGQDEGRGLSGADPIIPALDRISGQAKTAVSLHLRLPTALRAHVDSFRQDWASIT